MEHFNTQLFELHLTQCEDWQELEALMREHQQLYVSWKEHLAPMLDRSHLNIKQIAKGCEISEGTVRHIMKKIPTKRENVIMLAMMMRLSVEETNHLLARWARFQELYPRNPSDAIWIYLLTQGGSDQPKALFRSHYQMYKQLHAEYRIENPTQPRNTQIVFDELVAAAQQAPKATETHISDAFRDMIQNLLPDFENGYWKLLDYINSFFRDLEAEDAMRLGLPIEKKRKASEKAGGHYRKITPNEKFRGDKTWLDAYYRKIRKLETQQIMPDRAFLLALGMRMSMNAEQINHMLSLARMSPLCAKDPLEGALVFILENLYCTFPSCFDDPGKLATSASYDLMDYSADYEMNRAKADKDDVLIGLPDISMDFDDTPVETIYDYISRAIQEHDVGEFGCDDYIRELFNISRDQKQAKKEDADG